MPPIRTDNTVPLIATLLCLSLACWCALGLHTEQRAETEQALAPLVERIRVLEIQLAEQNLRLCGVEQEVGTCQ